ncbi:MAG: hypothetical protein ACXVCH_03265 [Bdellovibrionota bacterium]
MRTDLSSGNAISPATVQTMASRYLMSMLKHRSLVAVCLFLSVSASMVLYKTLPRKYKVQATIGIQTQYFMIPLVHDFLPEAWDAAELKGQREAIIRRALDFKYLREIGVANGFLGKDGKEITTYDLENFSKQFEIMSVGSGNFLLGFSNSNPETGYRIVNDAIAHIRTTLTTERRNTVLKIYEAIRDRLEALSLGEESGTAMLASRPDLIRSEIEKITSEIRALRATYSDKHPRVAELTRQLENMKHMLSANGPSEGTAPAARSRKFTGDKVDEASMDLFKDLLKKYHYLEVVIFMDQQQDQNYLTVLEEPFVPKSPLSPKLPILLIWGVLVGFIISASLVLGRELRELKTPK